MNEIIISEIALQKFRQRVKPCPEPGNGVHQWVYHAACCAVRARLPDEVAIVEIDALMTRDPNGSEIEDALISARGGKVRRSPRWSPPNLIAIQKITQKGFTVLDLISKSPKPIRFGI